MQHPQQNHHSNAPMNQPAEAFTQHQSQLQQQQQVRAQQPQPNLQQTGQPDQYYSQQHLQPQIAAQPEPVGVQIEQQQRYGGEERVSNQVTFPHQPQQQPHFPQQPNCAQPDPAFAFYPAQQQQHTLPVGESPNQSLLHDIERISSSAQGAGMPQSPHINNTATDEALFDRFKVLQVGRILQLIAERGDMIPPTNTHVTPFHSHEVPNINILIYFVVVSYNAGIYDQQAPLILVLLERLCEMATQKGLPIFINSFTIHRLILTTVLVTAKMFNDTYYTNQYVASVGGATLSNINHLERFYMYMIDWNLFVSEEEFSSYDLSLASYQYSGQAAMAAFQVSLVSSAAASPAVQPGQLQPILHFGMLQQQQQDQTEPHAQPHMQAQAQPSQIEQQIQLRQQIEKEQLRLQVQSVQQMIESQNPSIGPYEESLIQQQQNSSSHYNGAHQTYQAFPTLAQNHPNYGAVNYANAYPADHPVQPQQMMPYQQVGSTNPAGTGLEAIHVGYGAPHDVNLNAVQHNMPQMNRRCGQLGQEQQHQHYLHHQHHQQMATTPQHVHHPPIQHQHTHLHHQNVSHMPQEEEKNLPMYSGQAAQYGQVGIENTYWPAHHHQQIVQQQAQAAAVTDFNNNEISHLANLSVQAQQDHSPPRFDFHQMQRQIEEAHQQRSGYQGSTMPNNNQRLPPRQ